MGAVFATVASNGSTNQSVIRFEEMVSTFLLSRFQERGVFFQLSVPGRPGMETVVCAKASAEVSHRSSPELGIYRSPRDFIFFPPEAAKGDGTFGPRPLHADIFS